MVGEGAYGVVMKCRMLHAAPDGPVKFVAVKEFKVEVRVSATCWLTGQGIYTACICECYCVSTLGRPLRCFRGREGVQGGGACRCDLPADTAYEYTYMACYVCKSLCHTHQMRGRQGGGACQRDLLADIGTVHELRGSSCVVHMVVCVSSLEFYDH